VTNLVDGSNGSGQRELSVAGIVALPLQPRQLAEQEFLEALAYGGRLVNNGATGKVTVSFKSAGAKELVQKEAVR
jgi:hypothetical protein